MLVFKFCRNKEGLILGQLALESNFLILSINVMACCRVEVTVATGNSILFIKAKDVLLIQKHITSSNKIRLTTIRLTFKSLFIYYKDSQ